MTTAEAERTVSALIIDAMDSAGTPDPHDVAQAVLPNLPAEAIAKFAERGIAEKVRMELARRRRGCNGRNRSATWERISRANKSGEVDTARYAVSVGLDHRWLPDCDPGFLEAAAEEIEGQAGALLATAEGWRKLASAVRRKRGAKLVGDLDDAKVRSILNA